MDALHERTLVDDNEGVVGVGAAVAPRRTRRPVLGRAWFAAALATLGLLTGAWLSFVEMPLAITVADRPDGAVVESVGIGSLSWMAGVRPEMTAEWQDVGQRIRVVFGPEQSAGYQLHLPGNFAQEVMLGFVLVAGAAVLARAGLPGAPVAAGAGVAIALAPALPHLGLPAAVPLALISAATAVAATRIPDRGHQRRFDVFALLVLGGTLAVAVGLMNGFQPTEWSLVWAAPFGIAAVLGAMGEVAAARARHSVMPTTGGTRASRMLAAFVPLAAKSRLDGGEAERSRMAIVLHNRVIPRVSSSAQAIRKDSSPDLAADRLDALAEELRGVVRRNETVTLESAGVGPAFRAHMEGMATYGLRVAFDIRNDQGRPPAAVELAAFRIGQAAIDNALKHSGGDRVDVVVSGAADRLELVVKDDGVGIGDNAEAKARQQGRLGLAQMWLRADAVGGSLDIRSHAGKGTEVRFNWTA